MGTRWEDWVGRLRVATLLPIVGVCVLAPHRASAVGARQNPRHQPNANPMDITPPQVWILWPAPCTTISGTVTETAFASDNVAVDGVRFLLDGADLCDPVRSPPYACVRDTTTVSDGSHVLKVIAWDTSGNSATSEAITVSVSNGPAVRFEETSATLAPAGAWFETDDAEAGVSLSCGRAVSSASAGAIATFSFVGTGVRWIGMACDACGIAQVHLDGSPVATVNTYAPRSPPASKAVYALDGLAPARHILAIEASGTGDPSSSGANVVVDGFDVDGWTGATGHVEEIDPAVSYSGWWELQSRSDLSGGSIVESADPAGAATLSFDGRGIVWIGMRAPWAGIADVYVDGVFDRSVDTYAPAEEAQAALYSIGGLPAGPHRLTIKVTFTWNPASVSAWVVIDAFEVL